MFIGLPRSVSYAPTIGQERPVSKERVRVEQERDTERGWSFHVLIDAEPDPLRRTIRLSWVDHEYWSHGGTGPSRVILALVEFLLERGGLDTLGESFDAAAVRRLHPDVDRELPQRL